MKFNFGTENGTQEMSNNCTEVWSRHMHSVVFYIEYYSCRGRRSMFLSYVRVPEKGTL